MFPWSVILAGRSPRGARRGAASDFHVVKDTTHNGAICAARGDALGMHATTEACADAAGKRGCKYFAHSPSQSKDGSSCFCCISQDPVEPAKSWVTYKVLPSDFAARAADAIHRLARVDGKPTQVLFLGDPLERQGHHFPSSRFLQLQPVHRGSPHSACAWCTA